MSKILVTGGTGLVGKALSKQLLEQGNEVQFLSRTAGSRNGIKTYRWDYLTDYIDPNCVDGVDVIIHLAGASVADKRWTVSRKKVILESRTLTTALLYKLLKNTKHQVKQIISASAIGIYGIDRTQVLTEESSHENDFLAEVCKTWEASVDTISQLGIITCKLRIGIVLSNNGGALQQMLVPIKLGLGSPLGTGQQMMSWIHIDDLCMLFIKCVNDNLQGAFNATSPQYLSNKAISHTIAKTLNRPFFFPNVPRFVLKILLGEMADIVLSSAKVEPRKFLELGVKYKYASLNEALCNLFNK